MEIIIRLGENENINQKISSLHIIIFIYPKLSEQNKEIVLNIVLFQLINFKLLFLIKLFHLYKI